MQLEPKRTGFESDYIKQDANALVSSQTIQSSLNKSGMESEAFLNKNYFLDKIKFPEMALLLAVASAIWP